VYRLLRENDLALCHNDDIQPAPVPTAHWGYVRLRRAHYAEADLLHAVQQITAQPWQEAYVFIKHEAPDSPLLARHWAELARNLTG
jgi:hypothetical protein